MRSPIPWHEKDGRVSYFAVESAEAKFCHRYPVEHNEYLFVTVQEYTKQPSVPSFHSRDLIRLHSELSEKYGKKPTILIVRPAKAKWWQFWRWF